jgi:hypothetical protein
VTLAHQIEHAYFEALHASDADPVSRAVGAQLPIIKRAAIAYDAGHARIARRLLAQAESAVADAMADVTRRQA